MGGVIYADVLFLINASCDLLSVYLTGKLCGIEIRPIRAAAAAAAGALCAVIVTILSLPPAAANLSGVIISFLICFISFGRARPALFLRRTALLWSSACLVSGAVSAVASATGSAGRQFRGRRAAAIFALSAAAVLLVSRIRRSNAGKKSSIVRVAIGDRASTVRCLLDTGSLTRDPIGGDPVVILCADSCRKIFREEELSYLVGKTPIPPDRLGTRLRIVPQRTLGGERTIFAVRPDSVTVDGVKRRAVIAVEDSPRGSFGSFDGIVPGSISGKF